MLLRYFTVEYDGYTYKKEEKQEEEKAPGAQYLINTLKLDCNERTELLHIISRMNTKSKWKDLSDKQERIYLKMEKILSKLKAYTPFSIPFLSKVSKREAPEYYNLIKTPIDLGKIGKKLFLQEYSDVNDFSMDLDLIWENCFKFNNTHGNIYAMYAQKMKEKSLVLLQDLFSEREIEILEPLEEVEHFLLSEKHRKEMVATRAAILQNPAEFTCKRTSTGMGEFWKQEIDAIQRIKNTASSASSASSASCAFLYGLSTADGKNDSDAASKPGLSFQRLNIKNLLNQHSSSLYLPEYTNFYNSFPIVDTLDNIKISPSLYAVDDLYMPGYMVYNKNSRAYKLGEKMSQSKKLCYSENVYRVDGKQIDDICMGRSEIILLLKKIVTLELISLGFTNTESSALNILVSYVMHRIEATLRQIAEYKRRMPFDTPENTTESIIKQMIFIFQIKSIDLHPPSFFSEDEDDSDEESIINMICSNAEDADIEIDDDII